MLVGDNLSFGLRCKDESYDTAISCTSVFISAGGYTTRESQLCRKISVATTHGHCDLVQYPFSSRGATILVSFYLHVLVPPLFIANFQWKESSHGAKQAVRHCYESELTCS